MYPALDLYPKYASTDKKNRIHEKLYLSSSVRNRINSLRRLIHDNDISIPRLADYIETQQGNLQAIIAHKTNPSLYSYLRLSQVFNWDLTHDLNYCYAMVTYSPEEILHRFRGIFGTALPIEEIALLLTQETRITSYVRQVIDSLQYGPYRRIRTYAKYMRLLSVYETYRGYDDALKFEE